MAGNQMLEDPDAPFGTAPFGTARTQISRKRYAEEIKVAFQDFKLQFDNFLDQSSQDQRSARKRKQIHAYLTQVFGHHHGMWVYLQTVGMPRLRLLCFRLNARWARLLNST